MSAHLADGPGRGPIILKRLQQIRVALNAIERVDVDRAAEQFAPDTLAEIIDLLIEFRRRLGDVESAMLWQLGRDQGKHVANLPDGRQYELTRSADRKEWQHEEWQHDVRREITTLVLDTLGGESLFTIDGEEIVLAEVLQDALALAQAIHGSGPPKTRDGLAKLGLFASDYATSTPGGWRMKVTPRKRRAPNTVLRRPRWRSQKDDLPAD